MPRLEEARAEERGNRLVGRLPMRSVSNAGHLPKITCCARLYFQPIPHSASDRKTMGADTECGIVYHACCTCLNEQPINELQSKPSFYRHQPFRLCYDGGASFVGTVQRKEGAGWTLSRSWIT